MKRKIILISLLLAAMTFCKGCDSKPSIRIGFAGGLTGRHSDLGTSGRNGVMLAVEKINHAGGIHGREVMLLIRNDRHEPDTARAVDRELIESGVAAIIGHMTSEMAMAGLDVINRHQVVMISPTASTSRLSGIDDYLFRVMSTSRHSTDRLVHYGVKDLNLRSFGAVYELSNPTYSRGFFNDFSDELKKLGGSIAAEKTFFSSPEVHFIKLAQDLVGPEVEGILITAGALDTAMICQQIRKIDKEIPIFSSGWAMTNDLIQHGGGAVEGVIFSHRIDRESKAKPYLTFKQRFTERFGMAPDFAAIFSFEAATLLFEALKKNENPKLLKETILSIKTFQGLQGPIRIDPYGDPIRETFLIEIRNGSFIKME